MLLATLCLSLAATTTFSAVDETTYKGIDVSSYQGSIDFASVADDGIEIVYIRADDGSGSVDTYFERNYANAKAAGLKIGFYHYITATTTDEAVQQAQFLYSTIKDKAYDCLPAMDFEDFSDLSNDEVNEIGKAYLVELAALTGYTPVLYSDAYDAENVWSSDLTGYPLWVANYGVSAPSSIGSWTDWAGFQYSDTGSVSGIDGDVDLDYFKSTILIDNSSSGEDTGSSSADSNGGTGSSDTDSNGPPTETVYTIKYGDTLSAIANRYDTTVSALVSLNAIANANLIYAGDTLLIPGTASTGTFSYTIQSGDTLWAIAERYGTTVAAIASLNSIENPNLIYAGDMIEIPA